MQLSNILILDSFVMTDAHTCPKSSGKYIATQADHVKIDNSGVKKCVEEILTRIGDGRLA